MSPRPFSGGRRRMVPPAGCGSCAARPPQPGPPPRPGRRPPGPRARPIRARPRASTRRPPKRPAWQSPFALVSAAALVVAVAIIVLNQKPAPPNTGGELFTPPITYTAEIVDGDSLGRADAPAGMGVDSELAGR